MTFGIFSIESGNALSWFSSEEEAFSAVRTILQSEPEAIDSLGLMDFDDRGHPFRAWHGQELQDAARGVHA